MCPNELRDLSRAKKDIVKPHPYSHGTGLGDSREKGQDTEVGDRRCTRRRRQL